jgi:DNA-binding NtrC family response regulator
MSEVPDPLAELIGSSRSIAEVRATIRRLVALGVERPHVLLEGEAGSGKSLVASLLCRLGRPEAPIGVVDCASTPSGLVAELLFGAPVERGRPWFRPRVLELATGGTVVLEEVCQLPDAAQAMFRKVLDRAQQSGRTWLIFTSNTDMDELVRHRRFGEDLFQRIAGVRIKLAPLRERGNDVVDLANWLLPRICTQQHRLPMSLAPEVGPRLRSYSWPGNVRELIHRLTRMAIVSTGSIISTDDLDLPTGLPHD